MTSTSNRYRLNSKRRDRAAWEQQDEGDVPDLRSGQAQRLLRVCARRAPRFDGVRRVVYLPVGRSYVAIRHEWGIIR